MEPMPRIVQWMGSEAIRLGLDLRPSLIWRGTLTRGSAFGSGTAWGQAGDQVSSEPAGRFTLDSQPAGQADFVGCERSVTI